MAEASEQTRRLRRGQTVGPLAGVPLGVKDIEEASGLPTSFGCGARPGGPGGKADGRASAELFRDNVAHRDSVQVRACRGRAPG